MGDIPNKPEIDVDPKLDKVEFETEADKLRMDHDEAKKKAAFERVPRTGKGADLEHHRRVAGLRRRFLESVGQEQGWKDLPKGLVEAAKALMLNAKHVEQPKSAPDYKCKPEGHPHVEVNSLKKKVKPGEEPQ